MATSLALLDHQMPSPGGMQEAARTLEPGASRQITTQASRTTAQGTAPPSWLPLLWKLAHFWVMFLLILLTDTIQSGKW